MSAPQAKKRKVPGALKQFWWDLLPKNSPDWLVPPRSGYDPPDPSVEWITKEIAEIPQALEQTRRAHDLERDRVDALERKSQVIATLCLSLLATALALGGYQLGYLRQHPGVWWLLVPSAASVALLAIATIGALETQRVGVYQWEGAEPLGRDPGGMQGLVQAEEIGRRLAHETASNKANQFLQTRAWLSRALVALIVSAFVTIAMASKPTQATKPPWRSRGAPTGESPQCHVANGRAVSKSARSLIHGSPRD